MLVTATINLKKITWVRDGTLATGQQYRSQKSCRMQKRINGKRKSLMMPSEEFFIESTAMMAGCSNIPILNIFHSKPFFRIDISIRFIFHEYLPWIKIILNNMANKGLSIYYVIRDGGGDVSYTHLTLPTKRIF